MNLHRMPTQERCPMCIGRGTNNRGSLCPKCHGVGEIPIQAQIQPEAVVAKAQGGTQRPARR